MSEPAPDTIVTVLRSDHAAITHALDDVTGEGFTDLTADLVRHFVAEEQYLLPAVHDRLPDGAARAERAFGEHKAIEDMLKELDDDSTSHERVGELVEALRAAVAQHVGAQEADIFPALERALDPDALAELGQDVLGAEQLAPTHPRYFVPKSATLSKITSWLTGLVEKSWDSRDAQ